jgi:excisionase family DNA binding protein
MQTENQTSKLAYSIKEACAATSIGRTALYSLIGDGTIETRKIGKRTLIPAASLQRLISGEA